MEENKITMIAQLFFLIFCVMNSAWILEQKYKKEHLGNIFRLTTDIVNQGSFKRTLIRI